MRETSKRCIFWTVFWCCMILTSAAHADGWKWVTPLPTGDDCYSLSFVDSLRGWIVAGGSGVVIATSDGGRTWSYLDTGNRMWLRDVYFADSNYGWVGGGDTSFVISRTTNGGHNWQTTNLSADSGGKPLFPIIALKFFGRDTGFAACTYGIVRTTDWGNSWTRLLINGRRPALGSMYFLDPRTGYVCSDSLFRTTNAGSTWVGINAQVGGEGIYFRDTLTGWIASSVSGIWMTTDGGISWSSQTGSISLTSLSFPEPGYGWAFGKDGIYASTDGGGTWYRQSTVGATGGGRMTSRWSGFAAGYGAVFRTTDGGMSWDTLGSRVTSGVSLCDVILNNTQQIVVVGGNFNHGEILRSRDGGMSWTKPVPSTPKWLRSVTFADSLTGWVCGDAGTMLKTTDGGLTWNTQPSPTSAGLWKITFTDVHHASCAGAGVMLSTTDGGDNWSTYQVPNGDDIRAQWFYDRQRGWAAGGSVNSQRGLILHTTDGGATWSVQYSNQVDPFYSIAFQDSLNGWVAGDIVMRTTDAGLTWQQYPWTYSNIPSCIYFANSHSGWTGSYFGEIVNTSDGGVTWQLQKSVTSNVILAMVAQEAGVGYAVGAGILKTTTGGTTEAVKQRLSTSIGDFALYQCYPNPFNSSTTIRYRLSRRSHVSLEVYSILGAKVASLVNDNQEAGVHERQFVGDFFSSGVYFFRLTTNVAVQTGKMLLLK